MTLQAEDRTMYIVNGCLYTLTSRGQTPHPNSTIFNRLLEGTIGNMQPENKVAASKIVDGRVLTDRQTHKHTDRTNNIIVAKIGNYKREKKRKSKFGHYGNRTHDIQIINTTLYPTELTCHLMCVCLYTDKYPSHSASHRSDEYQ